MLYQLIDLSWTMYRSYHSLGHLTVTINGVTRPTGHIYGALTDVERALKRGAKVVICLDGKPSGKSLNPQYKAGRARPDYNILQDKDVVIQAALQHPWVRAAHNENLEADEVIAALARMYESRGDIVEILSGDDDLLQTLTPNISIRRGTEEKDVITLERYLTDEKLEKKYHKTQPRNLPKYRALVGDKSDNLRGIERIPRDLAIRLVQVMDYSSPETIRRSVQGLLVKESHRKYIDMIQQEAERLHINYRIMNLNKPYKVEKYVPKQTDITKYKLTRWKKFLEEVL